MKKNTKIRQKILTEINEDQRTVLNQFIDSSNAKMITNQNFID